MTRILLSLFTCSLLAAPPAGAAVPTAKEIVALLDSRPDAMDRLKAGEILMKELTAARDTELGVSLAMLIRKPLADVDRFLAGDAIFDADAELVAHGDLDPAKPEAGLRGVSFDAKDAKELAKLASGEAGSAYNLSPAEREKLAASGGGDAAMAAYRDVLAGRVKAYAAKGLSGIEPYDRGKGRSSAPAEELRTAQDSLAVIQKQLPDVAATLKSYPPTASSKPSEKWLWLAQRAQGRPVFVLSHRMGWRLPGAIVAVERQYYAGHSYNCSLAVAGLLETDAGTVVVYASRVYTDEVAGGMGGMKRNIGRGMMGKQLRAFLDSARRAAEGR